MNITLPRHTLLALLAQALPVVDKKSAMPILSMVCMTAADGVLTMSATDLMVSYTGRRPATVHTPGTVCIDGAMFNAVVTKLPEGDITINVGKNYLAALTAAKGKRKANLTAMPGEDFPSIPPPSGTPIDIPAETLTALRSLTSYAMATDDTRPHLSAMLLEYSAGTLRAVTTDGHRLCKAERPIAHDGPPWKALVPSSALSRLRLAATGVVRFAMAGASGPVFFGDVEGNDAWSTKLVDASFPSYSQVIPSDRGTRITCDRQQLRDALSALTIVASDRTSGVKLRLAGGKLYLHSENPEVGDMDDELDADVSNDRELVWGVNSRYPSQTLAALTGERVDLWVSGELDPMCITLPDDDGFIAVIMPMRI